jgi:peptidoglycan/xylan/chitin deacetylase (PgdA/CDA1 family)
MVSAYDLLGGLMRTKAVIKKILLSFLSNIGFLTFLHYRNRHKICVLMLHGVMEAHSKISWNPLRNQLPPHELKRVLGILSTCYQFITVEQAVEMLAGKIPLIKNALLITLDDGYRNNIDYALPICETFGIKPVLFVATDHIDSGLPFWFDRFDYALQQNMGELISLSYQGEQYEFDATSREALTDSFKAFRDNSKHSFTDDIKMNQLFTGLSKMLEIRSGMALNDICDKDDWSAIATWEQLRKAVKEDRLDIASHTVNHWRVDSLPEEFVASQLKQSKLRIESELAVKCHYFCYPNGNYNKQSICLVKSSGYKAAFSTDVGLCQSKDDLMTLKRFNFPSYKTKSELLYLLNFKK